MVGTSLISNAEGERFVALDVVEAINRFLDIIALGRADLGPGMESASSTVDLLYLESFLYFGSRFEVFADLRAVDAICKCGRMVYVWVLRFCEFSFRFLWPFLKTC